VTEPELLDLIEHLYEAATDSSRWARFLHPLCAATNSRAAVLVTFSDPPPAAFERFAVGFAPGFGRAYFERYFHIDPVLRGVNRFRPGELFRREDFFASEHELASLAAAREWLLPQGLTDFVGVVLARGDPFNPALFLLTNRETQPFAPTTTGCLRALSPHLQRALAIHFRLVRDRAEREAFAATLDRFPMGVVCLDAAGSVVLSNAVAHELMAERDGLSLARGHLVATAPDAGARLRHAILAALAAKGGDDDAGTLVSVRRASGRAPYELLVASLRAELFYLRAQRIAVAVFIRDPASSTKPRPDDLRALYDLTPAQAQLAALLAGGESLDEIARALGLSINTIRDRVKQVFERTETSRQADLVRRLVTSLTQLRRH
jgi:DNA-binding CsgD family transcriptional regulator/PAS domain-containing protein